MAGTTPQEPTPKLGWKATVAGLVFALAVLGGFGAATAIAYDGDSGDDHSEETESHDDDGDSGDDHAEETESHDEEG